MKKRQKSQTLTVSRPSPLRGFHGLAKKWRGIATANDRKSTGKNRFEKTIFKKRLEYREKPENHRFSAHSTFTANPVRQDQSPFGTLKNVPKLFWICSLINKEALWTVCPKMEKVTMS